jgi:DNA-directed RNA polymerase subunit beta'
MGATIKYLDDMKDSGFKWATKYGLTVAITDMDPPARRDEILKDADDRSNKVLAQFRRGMLAFNEMQSTLVRLWQETYNVIGEEIVKGLTQFNPLSIVTVSGARGSIKQLAQLSGMRGLMLNQFNETIYELPVKNSFHRGLSMLEYFVTTHGARKGLADTALRTADAGYLTRRLCDVAQDVIIKSDDCGTREGMTAHRIVLMGEAIESLGDRIHDRLALSVVTDPETGEVLTVYQEPIRKETALRVNKIEKKFYADIDAAKDDKAKEKIYKKYREWGFEITEHGLLAMIVRSPLYCVLVQGVCAQCYGIDLSTNKMVEVGVSVGIIAAQSIGEPGTQLTMRTFHTGGVAGSATIARTNQYKTGKFIRQFMEDFASATDTDLKAFDPTKLLETQEAIVKSLFKNQDLAPLTINNVEEIEDPKVKKRVERASKAAQKAADKSDSDSRKMWEKSRKTFFYSWTGESSGIVRVEEIFEARRQPRGKAIICPVSGIVQEIKESSFGRFIVIEADVPLTGPIKDAYISDVQTWPTDNTGTYKNGLHKVIGQKLTTAVIAALRKAEVKNIHIIYPILVPPLGKLPVEKGNKVIKGDPLTEGPRDPHEVLELAGAAAVHEYFVENLQSVYKSQGVDINDKHVEVIIRQMMRKRQVKEPGDTPFLPGQIVDRFAFQRANEAVREALHSGKKIKYIDPISGENIERDPKEASANWILLGITEASLATDSFLSAASFQKTTRVLTEAAVRGKRDHLIGLKENVILGRLIPSGTGVKQYRDIDVNVQRGSWAEQSLQALVESDDLDFDDEFENLNFPSLSDMASDTDGFEEVKD